MYMYMHMHACIIYIYIYIYYTLYIIYTYIHTYTHTHTQHVYKPITCKRGEAPVVRGVPEAQAQEHGEEVQEHHARQVRVQVGAGETAACVGTG